MTISEKDFKDQCLKFVSKCQDQSDPWTLAYESSGSVKKIDLSEIYLDNFAQKNLILIKSGVLKSSQTNEVFSNEYNVIYSQSYEVPVLYFCISRPDGCPVDMEEALSLFDNIYKENTAKGLSQVEHPYYFRPFYMLHPCKTRDLMDSYTKVDTKNYLLRWLSTVATLVDLKLDLDLLRKVADEDQ